MIVAEIPTPEFDQLEVYMDTRASAMRCLRRGLKDGNIFIHMLEVESGRRYRYEYNSWISKTSDLYSVDAFGHNTEEQRAVV
jgi:hypothetical protein